MANDTETLDSWGGPIGDIWEYRGTCLRDILQVRASIPVKYPNRNPKSEGPSPKFYLEDQRDLASRLVITRKARVTTWVIGY